jgi:hypothetical protein
MRLRLDWSSGMVLLSLADARVGRGQAPGQPSAFPKSGLAKRGKFGGCCDSDDAYPRSLGRMFWASLAEALFISGCCVLLVPYGESPLNQGASISLTRAMVTSHASFQATPEEGRNRALR